MLSTTDYNTRSRKDLTVKNNNLTYSLRRNSPSCISLNVLLDNWMLEGCLLLLEKTFGFRRNSVLQAIHMAKSQKKFTSHQLLTSTAWSVSLGKHDQAFISLSDHSWVLFGNWEMFLFHLQQEFVNKGGEIYIVGNLKIVKTIQFCMLLQILSNSYALIGYRVSSVEMSRKWITLVS